MQEQVTELLRGAKSMATPQFLREVRKMAVTILQENACNQLGQDITLNSSMAMSCDDYLRDTLTNSPNKCTKPGVITELNDLLNDKKTLNDYTSTINDDLKQILYLIEEMKKTETELRGSKLLSKASLNDPRTKVALGEINYLRQKKLLNMP